MNAPEARARLEAEVGGPVMMLSGVTGRRCPRGVARVRAENHRKTVCARNTFREEEELRGRP